MDICQHRHMVLFTAKLDEAAAPIPEDVREGFFRKLQHLQGKDLSPVLGYEHDMQPKQIYRMRTRFVWLTFHVT